MIQWTHIYAWGNNPLRAYLKGKRCRILARCTTRGHRSVLLEFEYGPDYIVSSPRALRRVECQICEKPKERP